MRSILSICFILLFSHAHSIEEVDSRTALNESQKDTYVKSIHEDDYIFQFILRYFQSNEEALEVYYQNGAESAKKIAGIITDLGVKKDKNHSFLEFASGYGMVSRHLVKEIAPMRLVSCDIHEQAVCFLKNQLGIDSIGSNYVPENLKINDSFDAVFALSFFSHMPDKSFGRWLKALYNAVEPGGYLIFTTHGQITAQMYNLSIPPEGILFSQESEQFDLDTNEYGGSIVSHEYVLDQVYQYLNNDIFFFAEGEWWGHQDLYIIKKPN